MKGSELLTRAATVLQDSDHTRWPLPELVNWINDGTRTLVAIKPSASSESVVLTLVEGTRQTLDEPNHIMLLRLPRNLTSAGPPRAGGRAIRPVDREALDQAEPLWHDRKTVPFRKEVRQYVFDEEEPRTYYVYPGNDGTGMVEAVIAVLPDLLTAGTADANTLTSYGANIALDEPYPVILLDYVLSRAFSKDDVGADPGRAGMHMQAFMGALGVKAQVEGSQSPNVKGKVSGS